MRKKRKIKGMRNKKKKKDRWRNASDDEEREEESEGGGALLGPDRERAAMNMQERGAVRVRIETRAAAGSLQLLSSRL